MGKRLNEQGRRAQAEFMRCRGEEETARAIERGDVEFYPGDLEMLGPDEEL
jgi:hypothetical protein